jgi:hypothetical protein
VDLEELVNRASRYWGTDKDVALTNILLQAVGTAQEEIAQEDRDFLVGKVVSYRHVDRTRYGVVTSLYAGSGGTLANVTVLLDSADPQNTHDVWALRSCRVIALNEDVTELPEGRSWRELLEEWNEQTNYVTQLDQYGSFWKYGEPLYKLPVWQRSTIWTDLADNRLVSVALRERDIFNLKRRRSLRFARFIEWAKRKTSSDIPDAETLVQISEMWGEYVYHRDEKFRFELVSGGELYDAYTEDGSPYSCMQSGYNISLYTENPERVSVLKLYFNGDYDSRALVWTTDSGRKVLDQIYPYDDSPQLRAMERYAKQQGWMVRRWDDDYRHETITLRPPSDGRFPYIDTYMYCTIRGADLGLTGGDHYDVRARIIDLIRMGEWPERITLSANCPFVECAAILQLRSETGGKVFLN